MSASYYSHGKLLITGEYMVLRGAKALAVPTRLGQTFEFEAHEIKELHWIALDRSQKPWFTAIFSTADLNVISSSNIDIARRLQQLLQSVIALNPIFKIQMSGTVTMQLEFDREWGLGSSSCLISSVARWSSINPYALLEKSFGGSGYDLACATATSAVCFQRSGVNPKIEGIDFNPPFVHQLYLVYLNQKQNSQKEVNAFKNIATSSKTIEQMNALTAAAIRAENLETWNALVTEHEDFMGALLQKKPVQQVLFSDFNGSVKSLGAWGGDFVLASGEGDVATYFRQQGFTTIFKYETLVLV